MSRGSPSGTRNPAVHREFVPKRVARLRRNAQERETRGHRSKGCVEPRASQGAPRRREGRVQRCITHDGGRRGVLRGARRRLGSAGKVRGEENNRCQSEERCAHVDVRSRTPGSGTRYDTAARIALRSKPTYASTSSGSRPDLGSRQTWRFLSVMSSPVLAIAMESSASSPPV